MILSVPGRLAIGVALLALPIAACGNSSDDPDTAADAAPPAAMPFRYNREFIFVGNAADPVVVAPFTFRAIDDGEQLHRVVQGWLARGETWDRFVDDTTVTSRAGGVWRVVPVGDLRVIAGGPSELETLRFSRAERRLRLELGGPITDWNQGGETRFRVLDGRLIVGAEATVGSVLELLRVERTADDGWPSSQEIDALFLTSGDSVQLVMAEGTAENEPSFTWLRTTTEDRGWDDGEIRWMEMRPLQEARRDVPRTWSLRVEQSGLSGEIEAVGSDVLLGPERGGRRAVEIRFSVQGWVEFEGSRWPVTGMVRHAQQ